MTKLDTKIGNLTIATTKTKQKGKKTRQLYFYFEMMLFQYILLTKRTIPNLINQYAL